MGLGHEAGVEDGVLDGVTDSVLDGVFVEEGMLDGVEVDAADRLNMSTTSEATPKLSLPPAKRATSPMEVTARKVRARESEAVVQLLAAAL
jgi:hypothetical protein